MKRITAVLTITAILSLLIGGCSVSNGQAPSSATVSASQSASIETTDKLTGEKRTIPVSGLFVAIGQIPANQAFADIVELDSAGYIVAGEDTKTSAEGIFAAGDCRTKKVRQLTTAGADGAVAALAACELC